MGANSSPIQPDFSQCFCVGAAILFTVSVLWYWGSKRKVMALDSQKVLLADLFRIKHPADEDDGCVAEPPFCVLKTVKKLERLLLLH